MKEEYFSSINKLLSHEDIEQTIGNQIWGDNEKGVVKFMTLFLVFTGLLGVDNRIKILDHLLHLVNDLDVFC